MPPGPEVRGSPRMKRMGRWHRGWPCALCLVTLLEAEPVAAKSPPAWPAGQWYRGWKTDMSIAANIIDRQKLEGLGSVLCPGSPRCHRCGPNAERLVGSCQTLPSACLRSRYLETAQDEKNANFCFIAFCWFLAVVVLLPDPV